MSTPPSPDTCSFPDPRWSGLALVVSTIFAAAASSQSLRAAEYRTLSPPWQPRGGAFSIWSVLFALSIAAGAQTAFASPNSCSRASFALGLSASYLLCGAWALVFAKRWFVASALLICFAFAIAAGITVRYTSTQRDRLCDAAGSLLAGWLGVASSLGLAIASRASANASDLPSRIEYAYVAVALVSAFSVAFARPLVTLPVLWALAFFPPQDGAGIAVAVLTTAASGAVAFWRDATTSADA